MALHDLNLAWKTWTRMEATGWKYLPVAGGLLDQPEALMEDLLAIAAMNTGVKEQVKGA